MNADLRVSGARLDRGETVATPFRCFWSRHDISSDLTSAAGFCAAHQLLEAAVDRLHGTESIRSISRWAAESSRQADGTCARSFVRRSLGGAAREGIQKPVRGRIS